MSDADGVWEIVIPLSRYWKTSLNGRAILHRYPVAGHTVEQVSTLTFAVAGAIAAGKVERRAELLALS